MFDFPQVRVVQASAGSGKTYTLAKRYIQLLLLSAEHSPAGLKHILAITFTNKSAVEMKGRIIDVLKRLALGTLTSQQTADILLPLKMPPEHARRLAAGLMEDVIRHYHFFGVQTIDSFMNALLAGCAFKINLSARFKIKRDARGYVQQSLDQLIAEAGSRPRVKELFEVFVRQYLFLENRSGWFPKKDLLGVLYVLFNQYNTYQMPLRSFASEGPGVAAHKQQFIQLAQEIKSLLPPGADKRFVQSLDQFLLRHPRGFDVDDVSRYFARPRVPLTGGAEASDALDARWVQAGRLLRVICLEEAYGVFNPYIDVFNEVLTHFSRLQAKEDVLFLQQLNKKASELFDEGRVTVEELYFRLATRFHHYLVDEFQDTSSAQWRNLQLMVEEALSTGGSLFYVGDKKQAIYGFRGGHSGLFDEIQEQFSSYNVVHEVLGENYRSHKHIVEFNNRLFDLQHIMAFMQAMENQDRWKERDIVFTTEDRARIEQTFAGSHQKAQADRPHGAVRLEIIPGRRKDERDAYTRRRVLEILSDVRGRFAAGDIAVLTRNNAEVQQVTQWLLADGIHVQSERTTDVKNHPIIQELIAFLRFLHSPIDNTAFAQFLLGDLFPRLSGIAPGGLQEFLFNCRVRKSKEKDVHFYKCFRDAYPGEWEKYMELFFNQVGVYPLYELLVSVCGTWRCVHLFPEAQGFIMHFLELVKRQEEESCDLETFLEYFEALESEERFVPIPVKDAVQVLTVHKAKGLEFPVVIIPFLEMTLKAGASSSDNGQSFTWEMAEDGMHLMRIKESYGTFSEELKDRYIDEYKASFFAELNAVYVALTRPVWELHALIPEKAGSSLNPVPLFIPPEMFSSGDYAAPPRRGHGQPKDDLLPADDYRHWITHLREEFIPESNAMVHARHAGEIIHYALSTLGNMSGKDIDAAVKESERLTNARFSKTSAITGLAEQIKALIQRADWKPYFFLPAGVEVLCEQDIVNSAGDTRRVDRMIIHPDKIEIVDFKTSPVSAEMHDEQLNEYQSLAVRLYPGKSVDVHILRV